MTQLFAVAGASLALILSVGIHPDHASDIAITGARLVTVSGETIESGTIVITGGKIAALGADVAPPEGADVIDGSGKTVYPGLIDGLSTLGITEISAVAASQDVREVGDVNPHAKTWVALNAHSALLPVARAGGVTAALSAPDGGLISGQSTLIRLAGSTPGALTIKGPVAMHINFPTGAAERSFESLIQGPPEPKTFEARQEEEKKNQAKALKRLANILAEAKAYGAALQAAEAGQADAPRPDLPMAALAPAASGELPVVMTAEGAEDIRGAVEFAEANGLRLIIAGGLEAWREAKLLADSDVAVLIKVDRLPRREADPYDAAFANAAKLVAAGVKVAIVCDQPYQSRNLPYEAAMAHAYGLSADAAIRAITLSPAEIFGVADRMGSLEVGKQANIIVVSGDILDHRTSVTHVFIDGEAQSIETRHTRLYEEFKDRK